MKWPYQLFSFQKKILLNHEPELFKMSRSMKNLIPLSLVVCLVLSFSSCQKESQKPPTNADYQRAKSFLPDSIRADVFHLRVQPNWFADSTGFAYHTNTRQGEKYYKVLFSDSVKRNAFDEKRLADEIATITG